MHVRQMLAYARQHREVFAINNPKDVLDALDEADKMLAPHDATIRNLLKQRNLYWVHLSREHMEAWYGTVFRQHPTSPLELYRLARSIGRVINAVEFPLRHRRHVWRLENEADTRKFIDSLK